MTSWPGPPGRDLDVRAADADGDPVDERADRTADVGERAALPSWPGTTVIVRITRAGIRRAGVGGRRIRCDASGSTPC